MNPHSVMQYYYCFFIIICSALLTLILYFTPANIDDLLYPKNFSKINNSSELTWVNYWTYTKYHIMDVNGRLGDKLLILFLYMPKWLFATIEFAVLICLFSFTNKIALSGTKSSKREWLGLLSVTLIIFGLPWCDNFFQIAFNVNYIIGATLTLIIVYFFFKFEKIEQVARPIKYGLFLLTIITAPWHEGYGAVIATALALYIIIFRKLITKIQLQIFVCWLIGCIFFISCPGLYERLGKTTLPQYDFNIYCFVSIYRIILYGIPQIIYIFCILISLCFRATKSKIQYFCILVVSANLILTCFFQPPRAFSLGNLFAIIGIINILSLIKPKRLLKYLYYSSVTIIVILTLLHLGKSIYSEIQLNKQYNEITALYQKSTDGTVFYDIMPYKREILFEKISSSQFHDDFFNYCFDYYWENRKSINVIPAELKHISLKEATLHSPQYRIYSYHNYFISDTCMINNSANVEFENGIENTITVSPQKYTNSKGESLYYFDVSIGYRNDGQTIKRFI